MSCILIGLPSGCFGRDRHHGPGSLGRRQCRPHRPFVRFRLNCHGRDTGRPSPFV